MMIDEHRGDGSDGSDGSDGGMMELTVMIVWDKSDGACDGSDGRVVTKMSDENDDCVFRHVAAVVRKCNTSHAFNL